MNQDDEYFLKHSKKLLDESVDSLDAATLSRLNQARQKVLQQPVSVAGFFARPLPVTAIASLGVAVIAAWLWTALPEDKQALYVTQQDVVLQYEDLEMLTSDTELELLDQLEFVSWLVQQELEQSDVLRQQRLSKGASRWHSMSSEQKEKAQLRLQRWKNMPPEKRRVIRQRIQNMTPEQRKALRQKLKNQRTGLLVQP